MPMTPQDLPVFQGVPVIRIRNGDGTEKVFTPASVDANGNYHGTRELTTTTPPPETGAFPCPPE